LAVWSSPSPPRLLRRSCAPFFSVNFWAQHRFGEPASTSKSSSSVRVCGDYCAPRPLPAPPVRCRARQQAQGEHRVQLPLFPKSFRSMHRCPSSPACVALLLFNFPIVSSPLAQLPARFRSSTARAATAPSTFSHASPCLAARPCHARRTARADSRASARLLLLFSVQFLAVRVHCPAIFSASTRCNASINPSPYS
jgi:hypothetical protein